MTKILDCTIRDGGHLNGWNFSDECVVNSYLAALNSGADYFEIGYRFQNIKPEWGKFALCDDNFLLSLFKPDEKCRISVMINANKCSANEFQECDFEKTPINIVRVATYPDNLPLALRLCEELKEKGYNLFLNLMAISEYQAEQYDALKNWNKKDILEAIYFADSFGAFLPNDVEKYYNKLKNLGYNHISFHSHNNLQLAFANSIKAIELGAYSIDASIYGMGRSAGNLPAELITNYLNLQNNKYNPLPYLDIIRNTYADIFLQTPWGYNVDSLIAGVKNIHPYYVKELSKNKNFSIEKIWTTGDLIKKYAPISFNEKEMMNILEKDCPLEYSRQ